MHIAYKGSGRPCLHASRKHALLILAALVAPITAQSSTAQASEALRVSGASTIQPVAQKIAELHAARGLGLVQVSGGGSGSGVKDALSGASHIGMVSRALSEPEKAALDYSTIGYDALVFIVHESNPLNAISLSDVRSIFSGAVTDWAGLAGKSLPITTVNKEAGRSTLELFEGYSGLFHPGRGKEGAAGTIKLMHEVGSNLEMATVVGGLPSSIGYLSFGTAKTLIARGMPIKLLTLDSVEPSERNILSGLYPIARELNLVYKGRREALDRFIDLFFKADGQAALASLGFLPASRKGGAR
jgi:phosphate transport system substrate-binding protein